MAVKTEVEIFKEALKKISAQNVEGVGGFEMFRSCVRVAREALKEAKDLKE